MLKPFASLVLFSAILVAAQDAPMRIALTSKSNVPGKNIYKTLRKECPNVSIAQNATESDYTLEVVETVVRTGLRIEKIHELDITLIDHDGNTVSDLSDRSLSHAMKALCHAFVMVDVVELKNLTQSTDVRDDTSGGFIGAVVNAAAGRNTHTDSASLNVIINGEHALLDCYELATGCATIGPGKYYGERKDDGIWVSYRMPITHKPVRNHYKIAGSW